MTPEPNRQRLEQAMRCTGGCLCGYVRWEAVTEDQSEMGHCHCSMCRKAHGSPFVTFVSVKSASFQWLTGEHALIRYRATSDSKFDRTFCPRCGSAGPSPVDGWIAVPAGGLDSDPGTRPMFHMFSASKPPWFEITDALVRYDEYPERRRLPAVKPPPVPAAPPNVVTGSCLCGAVVFHITTSFRTAYNCHCGRCRKGRAAAHATNGFVPAAAVSFVSGQQNLERYKVPDARFFAQVFCRTCGSIMPKLDAERDVAVVPYGSLDVDPRTAAASHIYVAHKAAWFDVTDSLPQFREGPPK